MCSQISKIYYNLPEQLKLRLGQNDVQLNSTNFSYSYQFNTELVLCAPNDADDIVYECATCNEPGFAYLTAVGYIDIKW